jgi:hypothetical protein
VFGDSVDDLQVRDVGDHPKPSAAMRQTGQMHDNFKLDDEGEF